MRSLTVLTRRSWWRSAAFTGLVTYVCIACKTGTASPPTLIEVVAAANPIDAGQGEAQAPSDGSLAEDGMTTIFDLFGHVFGSNTVALAREETYRLYYLSGPGGSKPVLVECRVRSGGADLRIALTSGVLGQPDTWRLGEEWHRPLSAREASEVAGLAQTFMDRVRSGAYRDNELGYTDGAMVATEVYARGSVVRVSRDDRNDGAELSPFERKLFTLAARGFEGGIPGVRMRIGNPTK